MEVPLPDFFDVKVEIKAVWFTPPGSVRNATYRGFVRKGCDLMAFKFRQIIEKQARAMVEKAREEAKGRR